MIDPDLRALLVCPVDRAPLCDEEDALVCRQCGRRYPVTEGIPIMMPEDRPSGDSESSFA